MSLLTVLIIVAMGLTLLENTMVAVTALLIYRRQTRANAEMEKEIKKAIDEVKDYMRSPKILGTLKKEILNSIRGWFGGQMSASSKEGNKIAKWAGGIGALSQLRKAKSIEEKALIMAEWGMQKLQENEAKKAVEDGPALLSPEDYKAVKESDMSVEEYTKQFAEAVNGTGNN